MAPTDDEIALRLAIAANVRAARERLLLTQEEVAERAGLHTRHYQRIEAGEVGSTLATLAKLARVLRVRAADLLS